MEAESVKLSNRQRNYIEAAQRNYQTNKVSVEYGDPETMTVEQQPLQRALNEHGEQLDKLGGLLSNLEDRLYSIRNTSPSAEDSNGVAERAGSAVYNQATAQTTNVRHMQRRISDLLEELEI